MSGCARRAAVPRAVVSALKSTVASRPIPRSAARAAPRPFARSLPPYVSLASATANRPGQRRSRVSGVRVHASALVGKREQITVKDALSRIEKLYGADPTGASCQLVDVREPHEIATANLQKHGWKWTVLPLNSQFGEWQKAVQSGEMLDPSLPTFVLCHHGVRSDFVCRFLHEHCGFSEVYNILGGINVWSDYDPDIPKY